MELDTRRTPDLRNAPPRSPNEKLAGIVSLARMVDKAHANRYGMLGHYDIDGPHDKPVLALLGVGFATFATTLERLDFDDDRIAAWASKRLADKTRRDLSDFNERRRGWTPDVHSGHYFAKLKSHVAPHRHDVRTWFQILDLDEGRTA